MTEDNAPPPATTFADLRKHEAEIVSMIDALRSQREGTPPKAQARFEAPLSALTDALDRLRRDITAAFEPSEPRESDPDQEYTAALVCLDIALTQLAPKHMDDVYDALRKHNVGFHPYAEEAQLRPRVRHFIDLVRAKLRKHEQAKQDKTRHVYGELPMNDFVSELHAMESALEPRPLPRKPDLETINSHSYRSEDGAEVERHESFGCVQLSRCSGGHSLFGSNLSFVPGYMELTIMRAERIHEGTDADTRVNGIHGDYRDTHIATIAISAAQFAELITNVGQYEGVPCTLLRVHGTRMMPTPDLETPTMKVYRKALAKASADIGKESELGKEINTFFESEGSKIPKKLQDKLRHFFSRARDMGSTNLAWAGEMFHESTRKAVQEARMEVHAHVAGVARQIGLDAIAERPEMLFRALLDPSHVAMPTLPASTDEEGGQS